MRTKIRLDSGDKAKQSSDGSNNVVHVEIEVVAC